MPPPSTAASKPFSRDTLRAPLTGQHVNRKAKRLIRGRGWCCADLADYLSASVSSHVAYQGGEGEESDVPPAVCGEAIGGERCSERCRERERSGRDSDGGRAEWDVS
jgi:hypothetical protein